MHEPDRTFTEIIRWKSPTITLYDFWGIQRTSTSLTRREWERFTNLIDPTGEHRRIDLNWYFSIPGCRACAESTDLYLLGKPPGEQPSDHGNVILSFAAHKPNGNWDPELPWIKNMQKIYILMSTDGMHGPYAVLPMLAIPSTEDGTLHLHFLRSPYGACAFMNQYALPIDSLEDALLLKQIFEGLMGWKFLEKSNDRLEEWIKPGSTVRRGQIPPVPADLEVDVEVDSNGWVFRGPLKISDGTNWVDEIIYHRCALRVNRDGTVHFQFLKELVVQYPGYQ